MPAIALLTDPAEARALDRPTPACRLVNWRLTPRPGGALLGYATVDFSGWTIVDIPIFRDADGSLAVGTPSAPDLGPDGRQRERDGKRQWRPILTFSAPDARARRQRAVLAALDAGGITAAGRAS
jgi:hypothetical protein